MNSLVNKQFDKVAEEYDFVTELLNNNDFFISNMSSQRNTVLDVGCGSGILALELSKHYKDVIGIDISEQMLSIANLKRKKENIQYINMDANKLNFNNKFDFIVSRTTFHHLSDVPTILNKIKALLNKNGRFVILDNVSEVETPATYGYILGALLEFIPNCFKYNIHTSVRVFKHSTSKHWLEHLSSDKYLSEQKYKEIYGQNLPNCTFFSMGCFMGIVWENK
ncbi:MULTISPECIES: class I SAM-dependent methyltransferase [Clostridium]|uniref:Class I SAM-dependent methyltransferase n=1 Tax=Clostridium frigoriphilum TaxID=443253 RepID=A0ABU7UUP4_9CLOT|nr:class I SAM-dependent methyltransferase [Clostridium sp. DSM 17811]MBU3102009.1 class I SAM-dependent methyltransferase [Clostridium sp. DSM 17811]